MKRLVLIFLLVIAILLMAYCTNTEAETNTPVVEEEEVLFVSSVVEDLVEEEIFLSTCIVEEPEEIRPVYENIPLSDEVLDYTYQLCQEYNISYELVLAIMYTESSFRDWVVSKSGDFGIMQINKVNFPRLRDILGIKDFLQVENNILAGIYMLSELNEKYDSDLDLVLLAYNNGEYGATRLIDKGIYKTKYTIKVKRIKSTIEREGRVY